MYQFLTSADKPCLQTGISILDIILPRADNPIVDCLIKDLRAGFLLFAIILLIVSVAILTDFCLGIIKSISAGRRIRSFRIRDSFHKMVVYYGSICLVFFVDMIFISHNIFDRPYLAMIVAGGVIITEILSWFESLDDKERSKIRRGTSILAKAIESSNIKIKVSDVLNDISQTKNSTKLDEENKENNL